MGKSMMEHLAELDPEARALALEGMDPEVLLWDWSVWGRPEQQAPAGDWNVWLVLAGRGFGKTRLASEWVREQARYTTEGQRRFALVARTAADVRDVLQRLPTQPNSRIEELLPHRWQPACSAAP